MGQGSAEDPGRARARGDHHPRPLAAAVPGGFTIDDFILARFWRGHRNADVPERAGLHDHRQEPGNLQRIRRLLAPTALYHRGQGPDDRREHADVGLRVFYRSGTGAEIDKSGRPIPTFVVSRCYRRRAITTVAR